MGPLSDAAIKGGAYSTTVVILIAIMVIPGLAAIILPVMGTGIYLCELSILNSMGKDQEGARVQVKTR